MPDGKRHCAIVLTTDDNSFVEGYLSYIGFVRVCGCVPSTSASSECVPSVQCCQSIST